MQATPSWQSKLPQVGTTIFSRMTALAEQHGAINLSQGFPEFQPPQMLLDGLARHAAAGRNQYAPLAGILPLREVLAEQVLQRTGTEYHPETEITVTAGATQALAAAISATVRENDEVILFTPAYDSYAPMVELQGAKPVFVQLTFPDYRIDWEQVKKLVNHRTRMIILNSPHNPSGRIWQAGDLQELERLTENSNIILLSDEVYEHLVYDGRSHLSLASSKSLAQRAFVIGSFGKTFNATGWKVGYCLGPADLMREFRKVHQFMVFSVHTPTQFALAEALGTPGATDIAASFQHRRDLFREAMSTTRFIPMPCEGTYFQLFRYDGISEEGDVEFAERLVREYGVAAIPVSVFYQVHTDHRVLRFCFAKEDDTLLRAAAKLSKL